MSLVPIATLSTLTRKHSGFPFGSLMPFALDSAGRPIFLISNMAMHTQNLRSNPRCSLFVAQAGADGDPLGAARATLIGNAEPISDNDVAEAREKYLSRHENSRYWVDFSDFGFFRLQPIDIYYVGGFGVMGWVEARDYEHAGEYTPQGEVRRVFAQRDGRHSIERLCLVQLRAGQLEQEIQSRVAVPCLVHIRARSRQRSRQHHPAKRRNISGR